MFKYYTYLLYIVIGKVIVVHIMWFTFYRRNKNRTRPSYENNYDNPQNKYILIWPFKPSQTYVYFYGEGPEKFYSNNCSVRNCYFTSHKNLLKDIRDFDVILFFIKELNFDGHNETELPRKRSQKQLYVFASTESSHYYPVPKDKYNSYFNFTWTYKLNSDLEYSFIKIRDKKGKLIGPAENIKWLPVDKMLPINNKTQRILNNKTKLGAWFASNCNSKNQRENLVKKLQKELVDYGLTIDVYGSCGNKHCKQRNVRHVKECLKLLQQDYYFYFVLENSMSEDYVTEKLLRALDSYTIPVVYGGANYSRFMPEGIYLDASKLSIKELAMEMVKIINNKDVHYKYFRWHSHYSYHAPDESSETDSLCNLCEYVNRLNETKIVDDLVKWWNK